MYKILFDNGQCLDLGDGKMEGPITARRQYQLHSIMKYYKDDLDWDYEAGKCFCGIIVGAGTAELTAGIGETLLYKPAVLD